MKDDLGCVGPKWNFMQIEIAKARQSDLAVWSCSLIVQGFVFLTVFSTEKDRPEQTA